LGEIQGRIESNSGKDGGLGEGVPQKTSWTLIWKSISKARKTGGILRQGGIKGERKEARRKLQKKKRSFPTEGVRVSPPINFGKGVEPQEGEVRYHREKNQWGPTKKQGKTFRVITGKEHENACIADGGEERCPGSMWGQGENREKRGGGRSPWGGELAMATARKNAPVAKSTFPSV